LYKVELGVSVVQFDPALRAALFTNRFGRYTLACRAFEGGLPSMRICRDKEAR